MVTYVPYSMGRMEYNWGPDAASFKPERWLKDGFFQSANPFKFTAFQVSPWSSIYQVFVFGYFLRNPIIDQTLPIRSLPWRLHSKYLKASYQHKHFTGHYSGSCFVFFLLMTCRLGQGYALGRTLHIFKWRWLWPFCVGFTNSVWCQVIQWSTGWWQYYQWLMAWSLP